jgi:DNA mismatch endonuclease (patch repair protein)
MASIGKSETKPEILVRKFLFANGYRFRKNVRNLPGTPDIVLPKYKVVIFVHGCFWHGHLSCTRSKLPTTNVDFWKKKIEGNKYRDKAQIYALKKMGWKVITIWQCSMRNNHLKQKQFNKLLKSL